MQSNSLSKKDRQLLKNYAEKLPIIMINTHEVHVMKGEELIQMGYVIKENEVIDEGKTYIYNMPVKIAINHYRRLKQAWKKEGEQGIKRYLTYVAEIIKKHPNG